MSILVTGAAGFIGYHLCHKLLIQGHTVIGFDNLNDYYDVSLKEARLKQLELTSSSSTGEFIFVKESLENNNAILSTFSNYRPKIVVNLAAQAGVRYSIDNPSAYIQSNLLGYANILEACRKFSVDHFLYASSSSVYGGNTQYPLSESQNVDHPIVFTLLLKGQ